MISSQILASFSGVIVHLPPPKRCFSCCRVLKLLKQLKQLLKQLLKQHLKHTMEAPTGCPECRRVGAAQRR